MMLYQAYSAYVSFGAGINICILIDIWRRTAEINLIVIINIDIGCFEGGLAFYFHSGNFEVCMRWASERRCLC